MAGDGIPGIAVGMAGAAALLMYAGFQGTDPLTALRDISTGKPTGLTEKAGARTALYEGVAVSSGSGGVAQASLGSAQAGTHPEFVQAAKAHVEEKYSQARRWQDGYSDCSSFIGKILKDCGIKPPGASVTSSYLAWRQTKQVAKSSIGPGDFLVSSGHIALAINGQYAVGQQNGRVNVQVGTISTIMWGQQWQALRYTGSAGSVST